eukprot:8482497-Karenia_brevis.AAC.1
MMMMMMMMMMMVMMMIIVMAMMVMHGRTLQTSTWSRSPCGRLKYVLAQHVIQAGFKVSFYAGLRVINARNAFPYAAPAPNLDVWKPLTQ